jgi:hypothetical protein
LIEALHHDTPGFLPPSGGPVRRTAECVVTPTVRVQNVNSLPFYQCGNPNYRREIETAGQGKGMNFCPPAFKESRHMTVYPAGNVNRTPPFRQPGCQIRDMHRAAAGAGRRIDL